MKKFVLGLLLLLAGSVRAHEIFEVPYTMLNGHIYVTAMVNGIEGRYVVDTAGAMLMTHRRAKEGDGSDEGKTISITDGVGNIMDSIRIMVFNSLKLGTLHVPDRSEFVTLDERAFLDTLDIDGMIGRELLSKYAVKFDPERGKILFSESADAYGLNEADAIPMRLDEEGNVFIDIGLRQGSETVMFDTGCPDLLILKKDSYGRITDISALEVVETSCGSRFAGAFGPVEEEEWHEVKIAELALGYNKLTDVTAETSSGHKWSLLGSSILEYGAVVLDYPSRKFYFEPKEN